MSPLVPIVFYLLAFVFGKMGDGPSLFILLSLICFALGVIHTVILF